MNDEWSTYKSMWASRFRENLLNVTRDYSLSELTRLTGISTRSLSEYISGQSLPGAWNLIRLARGLGVPVTDIFDYFY